jgi:hypothetical protein
MSSTDSAPKSRGSSPDCELPEDTLDAEESELSELSLLPDEAMLYSKFSSISGLGLRRSRACASRARTRRWRSNFRYAVCKEDMSGTR